MKSSQYNEPAPKMPIRSRCLLFGTVRALILLSLLSGHVHALVDEDASVKDAKMVEHYLDGRGGGEGGRGLRSVIRGGYDGVRGGEGIRGLEEAGGEAEYREDGGGAGLRNNMMEEAGQRDGKGEIPSKLTDLIGEKTDNIYTQLTGEENHTKEQYDVFRDEERKREEINSIKKDADINEDQPRSLQSSRCGCSSCSSNVLGEDAQGHLVGARIDWLKSNRGRSEIQACQHVCGKEFPDVCGKECNPDVCSSGSGGGGSVQSITCGCSSCSSNVLGKDAQGHRVGARIDWLKRVRGRSEKQACQQICGKEFPDVCGNECNPDVCSSGSGGGKSNPNPTPMVNVAKGKPAKQSSQYHSYEASRAVDGNIDGHNSRGSITHTKIERNPYWEVDLGGTYRLEEMKVFNRQDCCGNRLKDFEVIILRNRVEVWKYSDRNSIVPRMVSLTVPSVLGDSIKVILPGDNRVLTLAEVEAYGTCVSSCMTDIAVEASDLGLCQGDCDSDADCKGDLRCWQRGSNDPGPPGCVGNPSANWDYCYKEPHRVSSYFSDRYIDEIFIITTHNSLAITYRSILSPNQDRGLATQFNDGIRGFNFDLYMDGNIMKTHHGGKFMNYQPIVEIFQLINKLKGSGEFIIIQLQSELNDEGNRLLSTWFGSLLVKNFDSNIVLGDYLRKGQQVLIVTDGKDNPSIGIHSTKEFISENNYKWSDRYGSPPMDHRRGPTNPNQSRRYMRNMNYFCSIGLGDSIASYVVHDVERALGNIRNFEKQSYSGGRVNTLMVDFYREGDSARGEYEIFMIQYVMRNAGSGGFREGQDCKYTWDGLCAGSLECAKQDYYNQNKYICCKDAIVPFGWTTDLCVQQNEGGRCPTTEDAECAGSLECGKKDYYNQNTYVCCKDTVVPFGWSTDLCVQQNEGDRCPTTEDKECAGSLECGKRSKSDETYICCRDTYVPLFWTTDVCE